MSNVYFVKKSGLDEAKIKQALDMLLIDRRNEFRELYEVLLKTTKSSGPVPYSEQFILNF